MCIIKTSSSLLRIGCHKLLEQVPILGLRPVSVQANWHVSHELTPDGGSAVPSQSHALAGKMPGRAQPWIFGRRVPMWKGIISTFWRRDNFHVLAHT